MLAATQVSSGLPLAKTIMHCEKEPNELADMLNSVIALPRQNWIMIWLGTA
jgi:hypothetical protein